MRRGHEGQHASPVCGERWREELRTLRRLDPIASIADRTSVIQRGTPGRQCLVVLDGVLRVERDGRSPAGLGGQFVGEMALLTGLPCNADVVAVPDASVLVLNRREFASMLDECPTIATSVPRTAVSRLARAA